MKPLAAQTPTFWQKNFKITPDIAKTLYDIIVEAGQPQSADTLALFLVQQVIEEQKRGLNVEREQGRIYKTKDHYETGEKIVFPQFDYKTATVLDTRPGFNPQDDAFTVLEVRFDTIPDSRFYFAADLKSPHPLAEDAQSEAEAAEDAISIQAIFQENKHRLALKVDEALNQQADIIRFNQYYFIKDLLVDVQEGLLNIVDAAIDINAAPLNVDDLIEQMDLSGTGKITDRLRFSVNYCLNQDNRFINVGALNQTLWYLKRLMSPELLQPHPRLVEEVPQVNIRALSPESVDILSEIEDPDTPVTYLPQIDPEKDTFEFVLTYPYWRSGALPVMPALLSLLPDDDNPLIHLDLLDGQSGDTVSGWFVQEHNYIMGLGDWFSRYQIPVGAFIALKKTDDPLKLLIDIRPKRQQQEWVRSVTVQGKRLALQMKQQAFSCEYDELMLVDDSHPKQTDDFYQMVQEANIAIKDLVHQIFPELIKLTSQGTVHVKTLYSVINVIKRCPPALLLHTLENSPTFSSIGHGYWTYQNTQN